MPVPKSEDPHRLRENFAVFDFTLTPEDVARLSALDRGDELLLDPETWALSSAYAYVDRPRRPRRS